MRAIPVYFTADGFLTRAAFTDPAANFTRVTTDGPFVESGTVAAADLNGEMLVVGLSFEGFTKVVLKDNSATPIPVVTVTVAGVYDFSHELWFRNGLYVDVTGSGSGTVWIV